MDEDGLKVSFVIPVMNEAPTVLELSRRIGEVMATDEKNWPYEIVFVDDGSTDKTWENIRQAHMETPKVQAIRLRRNFGKAAALQVGIDNCQGSVVVTMDGDLQDDPKEIPRFLARIDEGLDVVSGWKRVRHDPLAKTLPSRIFNLVTRWVSGVNVHDFNCGFKAYRREVFNSISLYGELHRFVPVLAGSLGYKVAEIEVEHHPRRFGKSKYGFTRLFKGFIDLLTVITITQFGAKPGHLFGGIGLGFLALGMLSGGWLTVLWLLGEAIGQRPLLFLSVLLTTVGVQFILFGMLAELLVGQRERKPREEICTEKIGG